MAKAARANSEHLEELMIKLLVSILKFSLGLQV